ncbi:MAG: aromatic-ring-hydroxylating dioxygenase subunit beta [Methylobacteriaceae bacterium]|nr:aromatic-ring-hydroxylating dioxygenase subunit beta [Methylobacteriaceae bacterium]
MSDVEEAAALLFREATYLDKGEWDAWVAMYHRDAVFWLPAWRDEYEMTDDPQTQVSLIYHDRRYGLEERISRIESRKSITALPLPRTLHQIGNVELIAGKDGMMQSESAFAVHVFDPRTAREHTRYGRYEHSFVRESDAWLISRKKITLINDRVPTVLDFYSI